MKKKLGIIIASAAAALAIAVCAVVFLPKILNRPEETESETETEIETLPPLVNVTDIKWFDPNADVIEITDADMFFDFVSLSYHYDFKDKTVKLVRDITVNDGDSAEWETEAPGRRWAPVTGFAGTFDGQGHTISGIFMKTYNTPTALFADAKSTAVIRDFRLVNSVFLGSGSLGTASIASASSGTFERIYSNAVVRCAYGRAGGLISSQSGNVAVNECWFDGEVENSWRNIGGIADCADGAELTVSHSLNTGKIIGTWKIGADNAGGIVGMSMNGGRLVIDDCFASGIIEVANLNRSGTVVAGGDATSSISFYRTFAVKERFDAPISEYVTQQVGGPVAIPEADLIGVGGYQWTKLDFENYWVCKENDLPKLKYFSGEGLSLAGVEKLANFAWYDENASELLIETISDLYAFSLCSYETDYSGKTVKLMNDLVLNEGNAEDWIENPPENLWYPVRPFGGTFDGNNHSISGLYAIGESTQGFFARTKGTAYVKDFSLLNSLIYAECKNTTAALSGTISGRGAGTFDNVYSNAIAYGNGIELGGFIGQVNVAGVIANITNCWYDGKVIAKGADYGYTVGGFVGAHVLGTLNIVNSLSTATLHCEVNKGSRCGGLVGCSMNDAQLMVNGCLAVCDYDVMNRYYLGSAIGVVYGSTKTSIRNSYAALEGCEGGTGEYASHNKQVASTVLIGGVTPVYRANLNGSAASAYTDLDFERYWALRENAVPVPKKFADENAAPVAIAEQKAFSTDWYENGKGGVIMTPSDYIGFTMLSYTKDFKDETISLGANLTFNQGSASSWEYAPPAIKILPVADFAGTFDGGFHSISGVYETGKASLGLFAKTTETATVRNFLLLNSLFDVRGNLNAVNEKHGLSGTIIGRGGGTVSSIFSNAYIVSRGAQCGGIVGQVNVDSTNRFSNLWYDGSIHMVGASDGYWAGGIAGTAILGSNRFSHCLFTGTITSDLSNKGSKVGGIIGSVQNKCTVAIEDTLSAGTLNCGNPFYKGAIIGSAYTNTQTTLTNCFADSKTALGNSGQFVDVGKSSTLKEHELLGTALPLDSEQLKGLKGYQYTTLDFNSYWAARENECPGLKAFTGNSISTASVEKKLDTSWYNSSSSEFTISTPAQLYGWYVKSGSDDFAGKTIKLGADIDMNAGWTAGEEAPETIWPMITTFAGTLDGQGHTISGIYVNTSGNDVGFISMLKSGTVKNLKLINSYIAGADNSNGVGAIVGNANGGGLIDTVYCAATVSHAYFNNGGFVGRATGDGTLVITNSEFAGRVTGTGYNNAGFVGASIHDGTTVRIEHCRMSGVIETTEMRTEGGILGNRMNGSKVAVIDTLEVGRVVTAGGGQTFVIVGNLNGGSIDLSNVYASSESCTIGAPGYGKGTSSGTVVFLPESFLLGKEGYKNTELDFTEHPYWAVAEGEFPVLKAFYTGSTVDVSTIGKPDTSWYDESASEYVITTAEQLIGFANLSKTNTFAGKTVKLGADIDMNPEWAAGAEAPETVWPIAGTFSGVFDGQGHTLKGIYVKAVSGDNVGFISILEGGTVKNLRMENSYIEGSASTNGTGSIAGTVNGSGTIDTVYSSATVIQAYYNTGGILGRAIGTGTTEVRNVWYAGTLSGSGRNGAGIVGACVNDGTVLTITDGLVTGSVSASIMATTGGILGHRFNGSQATLTDCLVSGRVTSAGGGQTYAAIGSLDGKSATFTHVYATTESTDAGAPGYYNGTPSGTVSFYQEAKLTGVGGYQRTELDFENTWVAVENSVPLLKSFYSGESLDLTDVDRTAPDYEIGTVEELLAFAEEAKTNRFAGALIVLKADLDLSGVENFPMIGPDVSSGWNWFQGSFDGQGHTIRNLTITSDKEAVGFFRTAANATFKNIVFDTVSVTSTSSSDLARTGVLLGNSHTVGSTIENVVVKNAIVSCAGASVGGILGSSLSTNASIPMRITGCSFEGSVTGRNMVGGILGSGGNSKVFIEDCTSDAALHATQGNNAEADIGGIAGRINTGAEIKNTAVKGTITTDGGYQLGGVVGRLAGSNSLIEKADVTADITFLSGAIGRIGGIAGAIWSNNVTMTFEECRFGGTLHAAPVGIQVGGIVAIAMNAQTNAVIRNCLMDGTVVCDGMCAAGGVFGHCNSQTSGTVTIEKTVVTGTVKSAGGEQTGSIVGNAVNRPIKISDTYYDLASCTVGTNGVGKTASNLVNSAAGLTTEELKGESAKANAPALDFENVWKVTENGGPILQFLGE